VASGQWIGHFRSVSVGFRTIVAVERFTCLKHGESVLSGAATGLWRDRLEDQ